jgi:predicted RNA binding protein YcfA (HicA-like mRNA interferase family)
LPSFRRLSGADVIRILRGFGFEVISQRGSHAKVRRVIADGTQQTLHVPMHRELDTGTCRAIFRQACAFIPESELAPHFQNS